MSNPHQGAAILDDLSARGLIQDTTDVAALRADSTSKLGGLLRGGTKAAEPARKFVVEAHEVPQRAVGERGDDGRGSATPVVSTTR